MRLFVDSGREVYLQLGLLLALTLAVVWSTLRARAALERWRLRRRLRRGVLGQQRARVLLEDRGYDVLAEEQPLYGAVELDGQRMDYTVRLDYVVRRGKRIYGVEVKTGERATDPLYRATRRQLLEYSHLLASSVDGLLLLDMDHARLSEVRFPGPSRRRGALLLLLCIGFALGAAAARLVGR